MSGILLRLIDFRLRRQSAVLLPFLIFFSACFPRSAPIGMGDPDHGVTIMWHGHSCFSFKDSLGRVVSIDPFDETVGYDVPVLRANAVLITHHHFDHDYLRAMRRQRSNYDIVEGTGTVVVAGDLSVQGITSYHDSEEGEIHGENTMFVFTMAGLRIAHLGDLGQSELTPFQRSQLGAVDVLLVPVGGKVTIDAEAAKKIVEQLKPGAVFPMHYGDIRFYRLDPVSRFADLFPVEQQVRLEESSIQIRKMDLGATPKIYILTPNETNY